MLAATARKSYTTAEAARDQDTDIIQTILSSDLPPEEKTLAQVILECRSVVLAGTETTANFFVVVTWHLLKNPEIRKKLQTELAAAESYRGWPLEYSELRELAYLTGVVNEGLRLGQLLSGRLARACPVSDLSYGKWRIPRGVSTYSSTNGNYPKEELTEYRQ